jgi:hypothetical protein
MPMGQGPRASRREGWTPSCKISSLPSRGSASCPKACVPTGFSGAYLAFPRIRGNLSDGVRQAAPRSEATFLAHTPSFRRTQTLEQESQDSAGMSLLEQGGGDFARSGPSLLPQGSFSLDRSPSQTLLAPHPRGADRGFLFGVLPYRPIAQAR